jgi:hypothetical protein
MVSFDYGADDYAPEQVDLAAQLAAERVAREAAEARLAELERRHTAAGMSARSAPPTGPGVEVDLDALLVKVSDPSRPWPEIEAELEAAGFVPSSPRPSTRGLRGRA